MDPQLLVGRTLDSVVASWHRFGDDPIVGPVAVWLIHDGHTPVHITIAADWCLLVEESAPIAAFDMGELGRFEVGLIGDATPFAPHLGSVVVTVVEQHDPMTGRVGLELTFGDGRVNCDGWAGDLRLTALEIGTP